MTAIHFARTPQAAGTEAQHGGAESRSGRPSHILKRSLAVLTTILLALALAAFLALAIGPRILGYHTLTMLTGSMSPLINPGDVVVTQPVPANQIKAGDIITYSIPVEDQRVETHRVTELTINADGSIVVQTKGDANNGVDPWLATISAPTVDRYVATIPGVGHALRFLREPIILNALMYGAPAVLVAGILVSIWRKKPETHGADGESESTKP